MAEAVLPASIECRYCLSRNEELKCPRELPCTHVCCSGCLIADEEQHGVVRCPVCREMHDVAVVKLPIYTTYSKIYSCAVCTDKGEGHQLALMYCDTCSNKFCGQHKKDHDIEHKDHVTMSVDEFEEQVGRLETKTCPDHVDQAYTQGCDVCVMLFCHVCTPSQHACMHGKSHDLYEIDDLITKLKVAITKLRDATGNKEEELSALYKKTCRKVSRFEQETESMVDRLRTTKANLVKWTHTYEEVQEELVEARLSTQGEMLVFMEQVDSSLTNLSSHSMKLGSWMKDKQKVELVLKYRDMRRQLSQLIDSPLPVLKLTNVKHLAIRENDGEKEAELVPADDIYFTVEAPTTSSVMKWLEVNSFTHSICHYKGRTYFSTGDFSIDTIDDNFKQKKIVSLDKYCFAFGITIHEDLIYALVFSKNGKCNINVYNMSGELTRQWSHSDKRQYSRPAVVSNQLIVTDYSKLRLTVYSLTGEVIKHIGYTHLSWPCSSVCAADSNSVIVTDYSSSLVCRVDISTGEVVWSCRTVKYPEASALFGECFVCIATYQKLSLLNLDTGEVVSTVHVDEMYVLDFKMTEGEEDRYGGFLDIDVYADTLITMHSSEFASRVLIYKLAK